MRTEATRNQELEPKSKGSKRELALNLVTGGGGSGLGRGGQARVTPVLLTQM